MLTSRQNLVISKLVIKWKRKHVLNSPPVAVADICESKEISESHFNHNNDSLFANPSTSTASEAALSSVEEIAVESDDVTLTSSLLKAVPNMPSLKESEDALHGEIKDSVAILKNNLITGVLKPQNVKQSRKPKGLQHKLQQQQQQQNSREAIKERDNLEANNNYLDAAAVHAVIQSNDISNDDSIEICTTLDDSNALDLNSNDITIFSSILDTTDSLANVRESCEISNTSISLLMNNSINYNYNINISDSVIWPPEHTGTPNKILFRDIANTSIDDRSSVNINMISSSLSSSVQDLNNTSVLLYTDNSNTSYLSAHTIQETGIAQQPELVLPYTHHPHTYITSPQQVHMYHQQSHIEITSPNKASNIPSITVATVNDKLSTPIKPATISSTHHSSPINVYNAYDDRPIVINENKITSIQSSPYVTPTTFNTTSQQKRNSNSTGSNTSGYSSQSKRHSISSSSSKNNKNSNVEIIVPTNNNNKISNDRRYRKPYIELTIIRADNLLPAKKGVPLQQSKKSMTNTHSLSSTITTIIPDRQPGLSTTLLLPSLQQHPESFSSASSNTLKQVYHSTREFWETTLNPEWNTTFYIPLLCPKQLLSQTSSAALSASSSPSVSENSSMNRLNNLKRSHVDNYVSNSPDENRNSANCDDNSGRGYKNTLSDVVDASVTNRSIEDSNTHDDCAECYIQSASTHLINWWSNGKLCIQVIDNDRFNDDSFLGVVELSLSDFFKHKSAKNSNKNDKDTSKPLNAHTRCLRCEQQHKQLQLSGTFRLGNRKLNNNSTMNSILSNVLTSNSSSTNRVCGSITLTARLYLPEITYLKDLIIANKNIDNTSEAITGTSLKMMDADAITPQPNNNMSTDLKLQQQSLLRFISPQPTLNNTATTASLTSNNNLNMINSTNVTYEQPYHSSRPQKIFSSNTNTPTIHDITNATTAITFDNLLRSPISSAAAFKQLTLSSSPEFINKNKDRHSRRHRDRHTNISNIPKYISSSSSSVKARTSVFPSMNDNSNSNNNDDGNDKLSLMQQQQQQSHAQKLATSNRLAKIDTVMESLSLIESSINWQLDYSMPSVNNNNTITNVSSASTLVMSSVNENDNNIRSNNEIDWIGSDDTDNSHILDNISLLNSSNDVHLQSNIDFPNTIHNASKYKLHAAVTPTSDQTNYTSNNNNHNISDGAQSPFKSFLENTATTATTSSINNDEITLEDFTTNNGISATSDKSSMSPKNKMNSKLGDDINDNNNVCSAQSDIQSRLTSLKQRPQYQQLQRHSKYHLRHNKNSMLSATHSTQMRPHSNINTAMNTNTSVNNANQFSPARLLSQSMNNKTSTGFSGNNIDEPLSPKRFMCRTVNNTVPVVSPVKKSAAISTLSSSSSSIPSSHSPIPSRKATTTTATTTNRHPTIWNTTSKDSNTLILPLEAEPNNSNMTLMPATTNDETKSSSIIPRSSGREECISPFKGIEVRYS